jgi:hypothetical protein
MERRRKVNYNGKQCEGIEIPIKTSGEFWNEYMLEDGTVLRVKVIMTDVVKVDNEYDAEGTPVYVMKTTMISSVSVPEHLRRKESHE